MQLSNFECIAVDTKDAFNVRSYAMVDVTTGILWWKKTVRRQICKENISYWFFVDNGKWTTGHQAEELARSWNANSNNKLKCK